ncbi:MAG: DNA cytosine methyltransferase [Planctomycetota bacterium]
MFSGAGGGILGGLLLGWRTACAVEIDPYCRQVLMQRQEDGHLPPFPIWDDIRTFDGREWRGVVDVVSAGFPCQPFSVAGRQRGKDDKRNLWPETIRVICEVRPRFAFLENVPALLAHRYYGRILGDLAESGYSVRWDCIPASAVGANHQRDRLWIYAWNTDQNDVAQEQEVHSLQSESCRIRSHVADATEHRCHRRGDHDGRRVGQPIGQPEAQEQKRNPGFCGTGEGGQDAPDADSPRCREQRGTITDEAEHPAVERGGWWATEPDVGRVVDGMANRNDRLRALGNGQVPLVAATAWRLLTEE